MEQPTPSTGRNLETQERLHLGALVRSDSLPHLLGVAASIPAFAPLLKNVVRIGMVLDAHVVQQELRWRLRQRKKQDARTGLHEAIASGVIIPFAPTFLDVEIEEHLRDIAEATAVGMEDVRREWQDVRKLLHFYSPKEQSKLPEAEIVDPDDLAYIAAANELGMPIYSQDRHYQRMQAPVISVLIDGTARSYARSTSVRIAVMMGSTFTVTLSFEAVAAACRGVKRIVRWFDELHPGVQLAIMAAGIVAVAHPKSREKLAAGWEWVKKTVTPPVLQAIADVAIQVMEATKTENDAWRRLQESLPASRKRSALMHARAICLTAKAPLSLAEIERRMRADGYVTRARNFGTYLRRVLLTSGQFQESSPGVWALVAASQPT
jgi:hypothetical protein